jgi:hypothetical protein
MKRLIVVASAALMLSFLLADAADARRGGGFGGGMRVGGGLAEASGAALESAASAAAVLEFALRVLPAAGVRVWVLAGRDRVGVLLAGVRDGMPPERHGGARVGGGVHADGLGQSQLVSALDWPATAATATAWPGMAINGWTCATIHTAMVGIGEHVNPVGANMLRTARVAARLCRGHPLAVVGGTLHGSARYRATTPPL